MNDAYVTVVGWLAAKPICRTTSSGIAVSSLRLGCTPRFFDKEKSQWQDAPSMFVTVNCWRQLADNVRVSDMRPGEPLIVTGKLRIKEYVRGEELRYSTEIEALTLGYDMTRGTCRFEKVSRGAATAEDRLELQQATDQWASSAGPAPAPDEAETPTTLGPVGFPGPATGEGEDDTDEDRDDLDFQTRAA
jgi:single-strand DNA-binding protein